MTVNIGIVSLGSRSLKLPAYFPSISSVKTAFSPAEYLEVAKRFAALSNKFLISAYDLARMPSAKDAQRQLKEAAEAGAVVLMDSGNYESFWMKEKARWTQDDFHQVLKAFPYDLAFSFDNQNPPPNTDLYIKELLQSWAKDQAAAGTRKMIPIIHGTVNTLPDICSLVAENTGSSIIAVPERELGAGIFVRCRTVKRIREALSAQSTAVSLHLLGTGNPLSIALYVAAGANTFDGLEWCQTVVDHETSLLHHFSQGDFFLHQTEWGQTNLSFPLKVLAHNLEFFRIWMAALQDSVDQNQTRDFLKARISGAILAKLEEALR